MFKNLNRFSDHHWKCGAWALIFFECRSQKPPLLALVENKWCGYAHNSMSARAFKHAVFQYYFKPNITPAYYANKGSESADNSAWYKTHTSRDSTPVVPARITCCRERGLISNWKTHVAYSYCRSETSRHCAHTLYISFHPLSTPESLFAHTTPHQSRFITAIGRIGWARMRLETVLLGNGHLAARRLQRFDKAQEQKPLDSGAAQAV